MSEWIDIVPEEDFGPGSARLVEVDGVAIAVFNLDGEIFAVQDHCSHNDFPLLGCGLEPRDLIDGDQIICPRHGARFCLRTGRALTPPACEPLACFPVRVNNGTIQLKNSPRE